MPKTQMFQINNMLIIKIQDIPNPKIESENVVLSTLRHPLWLRHSPYLAITVFVKNLNVIHCRSIAIFCECYDGKG